MSVSLQYIVDGGAVFDVQAQAKAQTSLGVQVHAQHPGSPLVQTVHQRAGRGGLAHAALLVRNRNNSRQVNSSCERTLVKTSSKIFLAGTINFIIHQDDKKVQSIFVSKFRKSLEIQI